MTLAATGSESELALLEGTNMAITLSLDIGANGLFHVTTAANNAGVNFLSFGCCFSAAMQKISSQSPVDARKSGVDLAFFG